MDARLIVLEGNEVGTHEFKFAGTDFTIGRSASCDLPIDHSRVSMEHCRITRRDDGRIVLEDLHSTYGTFLNDRDVEISTLHDGDTIRVGPVTLLCAFGSEASESRRRVLERYAEQSRRDQHMAQRGKLVDPNDDSPVVHSAKQIFQRIVSHGEDFEAENDSKAGGTTTKSRPAGKSKRVEVEDNEGVSLVNLLDRAIIHDLEIQQISSELDNLIAGGKRRIVIDFGNVRHLSSQAVGILIQAQRRLKASGGLLKVCNPNPEVAEVFKITNLTRAIEIHVDENAAMRAGWPDAAQESPAAQAVASAQAKLPADPRIAPTATTKADKPALRIRLVIEVGKSKGKTIPINKSKFVIGRDPECQLRPASEAVSREHTRIEVRGGKVFVRDLGTTNGTLLGDRLLLGEEAEAHHGDRLQIGPLAFSFSIERTTATDPGSSPPSEEDAAASWLIPAPNVAVGDTALMPLPDLQAAVRARQRALDEIKRIKYRVVGDASVVTILSSTLLDEEQIAPVRHELISLLNEDVPKRVIVRMKKVSELSSLGIAMLMGHYQRLDRLGGSLRLCEIPESIAPPLEEALLTSPIRIYHAAEDAVRDPWPVS